MKKLFIALLLTGCVGSGKLVNECTKIENANSLNNTKTYVIGFENNLISNIDITDYYSADSSTIEAIKLSLITQNNFLKVKPVILKSDDKVYEIKYEIDITDEETMEHFKLNKERSKLVKNLEEEGFTCKVVK